LPDELTDTALERRLSPGQPKPTGGPRPEPSWAYVYPELEGRRDPIAAPAGANTGRHT